MPMAEVFSPKSSTFLIENLLKPGDRKENVFSAKCSGLSSGFPTNRMHSELGEVPSEYQINGITMPFHPAFRNAAQWQTTTQSPSVKTEPRDTVTPERTYSPLPSETSGGPTKKKKNRTNFTTRQLSELEARYRAQRYLAPHERTSLAKTLGLTDRQVKTWFQNRRMKEKRQVAEMDNAYGLSPNPDRHSPIVGPTSVQHHYANASASGVTPTPLRSTVAMAPPIVPTTVPPQAAPPMASPLSKMAAMTAQVSSAPQFQPLSIAVPSTNVRYSRPQQQQPGQGLLMVDNRKTYISL